MNARIDLGCSLGEISRLNAWLADRFAEMGLPEKPAGNIKLCLNEAVTNTISYGFADRDGAEISVELDIGDDKAVATLIDNGVAFDPLTVPEAAKITDLETAQIGGFGVKLMRELSSSIDHERAGGRNRLTMRFDLG
ncbi:MAG: hypothetical protein CL535_10145 [Ahrensia sp.]|nr:hypothetical protein [Ahrensia sp.]